MYKLAWMRVSGLVLFAACAGGPTAQTTATRVPEVVEVNVEAAALPYFVLDAKTGRQIPKSEFWAKMQSSQAVCVGESHTDAHHHWAQLEVIARLESKSGASATGMEMFQRPFQGVLDDFVDGKISEEQMRLRSDWKRRWNYDWKYYAPMVRLTVKKGGTVLALNVSKEVKDQWKKAGMEGLSEKQRQRFPELDMENAEHRKWFRTLMESMKEGHGSDDNGGHAWLGEPGDTAGGTMPKDAAHGHKGAVPAGHGHGGKMPKDAAHGHKGGMPAGHGHGGKMPKDAVHAKIPHGEKSQADFIDSIYPVQVLWDETMAQTASTWVLAEEGRQIVILAGHGHCHDTAIVGRMKRRGVARVWSVRPVVETGKGELADLLAAPENDYLLVMEGQPKVEVKSN